MRISSCMSNGSMPRDSMTRRIHPDSSIGDDATEGATLEIWLNALTTSSRGACRNTGSSANMVFSMARVRIALRSASISGLATWALMAARCLGPATSVASDTNADARPPMAPDNTLAPFTMATRSVTRSAACFTASRSAVTR